MRVRIRGESDALRSSLSFSTSGIIHGCLLALVIFGKSAPEPSRSLYDEAIRGREKQIVWYHVPARLPDVRPADAPKSERRPLRAARKAEQRIVAGERDDSRPPQLVYAPPSVELPRPSPLPNVLAMETKAPPKQFTPPRTERVIAPAPELPPAEAPRLEPAPAGAALSPLTKAFTPPPARTVGQTTPLLPDAPAATMSGAAPAGPGLAPLKRTFAPPPARIVALATPMLPEAEAAGGLAGPAPAGPGLAPLKRTFTPPPSTRAAATSSAVLPEAEAAGGLGGAAPAGPNLAPLRKTFTPPPSTRAVSGPPSASAPDLPAAHLAIVGLDPSKNPTLPAAPPPRDAGFSAGPKPEPDGAAADGGGTGVVVPGVTVRDGPTRQSLLAAIRPMAPPLPPNPSPDSPLPAATRVASAPDPMLEGRVVYTLAIQMPNITSYSGSWLVWYAERRQSVGGAMRAPSPVRKVDPKYIAAAAAEGVQGIVRLSAIIRKNGTVEDVKLLRHLDERLDRSAMESLAKWQFEPASRDGAPVEVDAVFEIPFRLAPKLSK